MSKSIYPSFVFNDKLISPINGYSVKRITRQSIANFGFESINDLHIQFPEFPLVCEDYKSSRSNSALNQSRNAFKTKSNNLQNQYLMSPKSCLQCEKHLSYKHRKNKFCNRSCAAKYNNNHRTSESRQNQAVAASKTMKKYVKIGTHKTQFIKGKTIIKREYRECPSCKTLFEVRVTSNKIYCTYKCSTVKPNQGGYREGSGRSKSGYYNGIFCGSTYELAWIIYHIDHKIPFQRFPGYLSDGELKYYPDFLLPNNMIIEIKGYYTELVDQKCKLAENKGYNIQVLYKEDLKDIFEYVSSKYQIPQSKFYTLYE